MEADWEQLEWDTEYRQQVSQRRIEYLDDSAQSIVTENRSPDIPFRYSVNAYRGCAHGCSYCYARNSHEFLGLNAGLDFETKIFVKRDAVQLFRKFLARRSWQPEPIIFSGVTDCYQPAEREFQLTRQMLQVAEESGQPISIITKNALVCRDLDLLTALARRNLVHVNISITTLDAELARTMEPRTSTPAARLRAVETLSASGVPVRVMFAPVIPGLNDHEAAAVLQAVKQAGAVDARYTLLRLPLTVQPVFLEWLGRERPREAEKVMNSIRRTRDGDLNNSDWSQRMVGSGLFAEQFRALFEMLRRKHGFGELPEHETRHFRPPTVPTGQQWLF